MIDSKKMKQIVAHIVKRDQGIRDKEHMYPMREWLCGIVAALVVVISGGLLSYWYYTIVTTQKNGVTIPPATMVPYDGTRIGLAIAKYEARDAAFDKLRDGESAAVVAVPVSIPTATTTTSVPISDEEPEPVLEEELVEEEEVGTPVLVD